MKRFLRPAAVKLLVVTAILIAGFTTNAFAQPNECIGVTTPLTVYDAACGVPTNGTTVGATQSLANCAGGTTADDDVWFSFVANGGNITITVAPGAIGAITNPVFEVFSGTCGTLVSIMCDNSSNTGTETGTLSYNFVNGQTYYIRVYSAGNALANRGTFTICVFRNVAANDNPGTASPLTPGILSLTAGCPGANTVGGNLINAGNSGVTGACGGSADDDVWYRFIAGSTSQHITLSNLSAGIAVAGGGLGGSAVLEVFSSSDNTATGVFTSIACGQVSGTSLIANSNSFVAGNTYFVRVYSTNSIALTGSSNFNICVANPPDNDACASAINLNPDTTCILGTNTSQSDGTLVNTTNSGIATTCGGTADDDVWYRFNATHHSQTITISNLGSNIVTAGTGLGGSVRAEVYSGSCAGALVACGNIVGGNVIAYANSLTVGATYFVRVYSTNNVRLINNANFRICVQLPYTGNNTLFMAKSFINITKGNGGGTVETGDVLEVRAAITLRPTSVLDSCAFLDTIPAGTNFVPGSLAILTNEGKVYKSFTDAANDDEGRITGSAVRINLGYNQFDNPATAFRKGRLRNGNIPTVSGSHVILVSYRVTVTAALNSVINLGNGVFTYSMMLSNTTVLTHRFNTNNVIVYTNTGLCANASGVNVLDAGLSGDFTGTFGSGNTINRVASPNVSSAIGYVTQSGGRPGDFTYTVTNNMSNSAAGYSTTDAWPKPEASSPGQHRIFGVWDVIGDHTGATNPLAGNPAADTTNGGTGGYMLLVNAAYTLDTVFTYPISGLCPNTYYEISFWVRNVCSRCGVDSVGRGASGLTVPAGYIPTAPGDSSGVYPNLSFSINGVNHYTTGNMTYTGEWVEKGFVFRTAPGQTNIVFAIANNAPGGGGNDWALDDIRLSTCTPNLNLVPNGNSNVCMGQQLDVNCDVISYFDNYTVYQWQVSHDNGSTWTDTLAMGSGSPVLNGTNYEYNAPFPSFLADSSQHLVQYRIRVATDAANLYGGCSFFNSLNIIVMVNNCSWVLNTNFISFDAVLKNRHGVLTWKTSDESANTRYEVQRSSDGNNFVTIGIVNAFNQPTSTYTFTDPDEVRSYAYYRIVAAEPQGRKNSRVRLLTVSDMPYDILSVVNPFSNKLSIELSMPQNSQATIILGDQHGRTVKVVRQPVLKGMNQIELDNLGALPGGTYVLQVITSSGSKSKRVIKVGN